MKKLAFFASLFLTSHAFAQEVVYNLDARNVFGVEYFLGNRTPPNTTAVAISAQWTENHNLPEKRFFFIQNGVADNCTKLLHIALAATLSGSTNDTIRTVKLETGGGSVITACKMGTKI